VSRHSQATAEAPTDIPRLVRRKRRRKDNGSLAPALAAIRARLLRCLLSRVPSPLPATPTSSAAPITDKDWQFLLKSTQYFANSEIHGYCWRAVGGGVLPSGYDASSIVAEAVAELFTEQTENGLILHPHQLEADLKKRARKIINRFHHRMENRIMRNEPDLARFLTDDGETISITEIVPAPDPTPLDILLEKEDAAQFEQLKATIRGVLAKDRLLLKLFECFCDDILKPKDQAKALKVPVLAIQKLQRRLQRKLARFRACRSSD